MALPVCSATFGPLFLGLRTGVAALLGRAQSRVGVASHLGFLQLFGHVESILREASHWC